MGPIFPPSDSQPISSTPEGPQAPPSRGGLEIPQAEAGVAMVLPGYVLSLGHCPVLPGAAASAPLSVYFVWVSSCSKVGGGYTVPATPSLGKPPFPLCPGFIKSPNESCSLRKPCRTGPCSSQAPSFPVAGNPRPDRGLVAGHLPG